MYSLLKLAEHASVFVPSDLWLSELHKVSPLARCGSYCQRELYVKLCVVNISPTKRQTLNSICDQDIVILIEHMFG